MIKVKWPYSGYGDDDYEVWVWLKSLVSSEDKVPAYKFGKDINEIYFTREDDAIAFKLRFIK